jgi:mutator protein MutT
MAELKEHFRYCPRCAVPGFEQVQPNCFRCNACSFELFRNPAIAVGALVMNDRREVLFVRRAKEPSLGKLGVPGGFVDFSESAEEALVREVREEVGISIKAPEFIASFPNQYLYKDVNYHVVDLYFLVRGEFQVNSHEEAEISAVEWIPLAQLAPGELAFPSLRKAIERVRASQFS